MASALAYQRTLTVFTPGRIACDRGAAQRGGAGDVVLQERGELVPGGVAVERLDGVADVDLVLEEPLRRRVEIGEVGDRADNAGRVQVI